MATTVVAGGGITGLIAAVYLAERGHEVVLAEREPEIGGLLRAFDHGEWGRFDYGMHTMFETGIAELDAFLLGLLPAAEWDFSAANSRDLAGVFIRGRLQRNSPYADLRDAPAAEHARFTAEIMERSGAGSPPLPSGATAAEYFERRFGPAIATKVFEPAMRKLYRRPGADLSALAARIVPMDRVLLWGEEEALARTADDASLRAVVGYPEQRTLPLSRSSGRRTFYPRCYGMYRVVEALERRLLAARGRIAVGCEIGGLEVAGGAVRCLELRRATATERIAAVALLVWTAGLPALAKLAGVPLPGCPDPASVTSIVCIATEAPLDVGDLHYYYSFEPGTSTYRVTTPAGYCSGAARNGGEPATVELLLDPAAGVTVEQAERLALTELRATGALAAENRVLFCRAEHLKAGFPLPSARNAALTDALRDVVTALGLGNLVTAGVLASPGVFFQTDVSADLWRKLAPY